MFGLHQGHRSDIRIIADNHIATLIKNQQQVVLIGTLAKMVSENNGMSRAQMDISFLRSSGSQIFRSSTGKVVLNLKGNWPATILPGSSIAVRATIHQPRVANVPGAFNYREYLARKNVFLTAMVQSPLLIQPVESLEISLVKKVFYRIEKLRSVIGKKIASTLPATSGSLYQALIIGDRFSLDANVLETLKRAGILHILAISGMHLGLLAALMFSVIYWLLRRSEKLILLTNTKKVALFMTVPPMLVYTLLAGSQPPVLRSFIMACCLVIGYGVNRLQSPLLTMSWSALLILLCDPQAINSPAFQLSFAAVTAIVLMASRLLNIFAEATDQLSIIPAKIFKPFLVIIAVTISATLGTLPLMLIHFNRFALVTLAANLLVEPIVCLFSLPIGFVSVPFMFINPDIASFLLNIGAYGLDLCISIAAFLSQHEFTQLWLPAPHPALSYAYYFFLGMLCLADGSRIKVLIGLSGFAVASIGFILPLTNIPSGSRTATRISIIDVGHGSANILELSSGRVVLIDGGARNAPGYDCGERLLAPYLWHNKIGKIDDIIITHDDADHYNGIPAIIKRFRPDRLWIPNLVPQKSGFKNLLDLARRSNMQIIQPDPGVIIDEYPDKIMVLGRGGEARIAQPSYGKRMVSEDDSGLVLKLTSSHTSMLFPGDITRLREHELLNGEEILKATILLSPHHGSSSSNSYEFLSAVAPDYMIFSSADTPKNLFPSIKTQSTVGLLGIATLNTGIDGTIMITLANGTRGERGYRLSTYNLSDQHYWRRS